MELFTAKCNEGHYTAKIIMLHGKQSTVACEMLTAVARDQSVQLKVALCCRWNLSAFSKKFVFFYNKSLWEAQFTVPLGTIHDGSPNFFIHLYALTSWG